MKITVSVVSDVICPWCYVGKRRLERAIAAMHGQHEVSVRWLPFELNPRLPREGIDRRAYRIEKFGSWEKSLALDARVVEAGMGEGILFQFDRIERTPNTHDAHRLIRVAGEAGCQDAVVEGLFQAYFTLARDLSSRSTLADVVVECGLDRPQVERVLNSDIESAAVRADEERAHFAGVRGVPSYFLTGDGAATVSGAESVDVFLDAFREVE